MVSNSSAGFVIISARFKSLSTDGVSPLVHAGAPPDATNDFMRDGHGMQSGADICAAWGPATAPR